ncbi:Forkhead box protein F1 [Schistosoma japonicum]|nr:Forkhead box protein F1 [Schistosoma japonicum]
MKDYNTFPSALLSDRLSMESHGNNNDHNNSHSLSSWHIPQTVHMSSLTSLATSISSSGIHCMNSHTYSHPFSHINPFSLLKTSPCNSNIMHNNWKYKSNRNSSIEQYDTLFIQYHNYINRYNNAQLNSVIPVEDTVDTIKMKALHRNNVQRRHQHSHPHQQQSQTSNNAKSCNLIVDEEPKPNFSYIGLIAKAILSTQERRMILSEIYQWIQLRYPYFSTRGPGWRNSIRHNLSLNDCFIKSLTEKTSVQPNSINQHTFNGKSSHLPGTNTRIFTSNSLTDFQPNQYTQNLQSDVTTSLIINPLHFSLIHNSDDETYHKSMHSLCSKSQITNPNEFSRSLPTLNTTPQILKSSCNDTLMDLFYTNLMYLFKNHSPVKSDIDIFTSEKNLPTTSHTLTNTTYDPTNHLQNNVKYENLSYPSLNHVITTTQQLSNQQPANVSFNVVNLIDHHLNHHDIIEDNVGVLSTTESVHYNAESKEVSKINVNYTQYQNEEATKLMQYSTKLTNQSFVDIYDQTFTSSNTSNSSHSVDSPLDYTLCR